MTTAAGRTRDDQRIEDEVDIDPLRAYVGLVGDFRIDRQQEVAVLVADGVTAEINHGCDAPAQFLGERTERSLHLRASGVLRVDHVEAAFAENIGEGTGIGGCRSDRRLWIGAIADHKRYPPGFGGRALAKGRGVRHQRHQQRKGRQAHAQHAPIRTPAA